MREGRLRCRHSSTVRGRKPPVGHLIGPARGRIGRMRVHGVPRTAKRFHALDAQRLKRHAGWIGLQSERHPLQIHSRATCNRLQQRLSAATPGRHGSAQGEGGEGLERGMIGARGRVWGRGEPRPVMTGSAVAQAMVEGTGWSRRRWPHAGRRRRFCGSYFFRDLLFSVTSATIDRPVQSFVLDGGADSIPIFSRLAIVAGARLRRAIRSGIDCTPPHRPRRPAAATLATCGGHGRHGVIGRCHRRRGRGGGAGGVGTTFRRRRRGGVARPESASGERRAPSAAAKGR